MLFNSFSYAVFLPIVLILYWLLPHKCRWALLLTVSYYFYMCWNPKYAVLILFTTAISYFSAILIEKHPNRQHKKIILIISSIFCLGVLFFFKYFNFISKTIAGIISMLSIKMNPITLNLLLPVGISFYTLERISYVIDVFRGDIDAEHHFGIFATFISYFPQLVAGPIERSSNLLPQIRAEHKFDYSLASYGLKQMAWGFFKKIVVADTIANYTGAVFNNPNMFQGFSLALAVGFFPIQIYCDFSGYSDIAIGTAKLMGINLMTNFKSPYYSQSIKEFWSRWHISLSTWFKDYVYIPLGGNRAGKIRHRINLLFTFLVSGLWHGADWTFVIWGGIHGLAQVLESIFVPKKQMTNKGLKRVFKTLVVFCFTTFAWVFFASKSVTDSFYIIKGMWAGIDCPITYLYNGFVGIGMNRLTFSALGISILMLFAFDYISLENDVIEMISSKGTIIRWSIYIAFIVWVLFNVPIADTTEFIYFQF